MMKLESFGMVEMSAVSIVGVGGVVVVGLVDWEEEWDWGVDEDSEERAS